MSELRSRVRRRGGRRSLAVPPVLAALAVLAAGCSPDVEVDPTEPGLVPQAVGGRWAYTGSDVRLAGRAGDAPCEVTGLELDIEQLFHNGRMTRTLEGRTSGGTLTCRGELSFLSGPLQTYPITNGHTFNEHIAFSIGTDDWRHSGFVQGDSMSGTFTLQQGAVKFEGRFVARRRSR
ncbi:MAG TPA: hypothetical protein VHG51_01940 [Longimicrobiaceae bacterium]|nr:hypothetical protein [Longimicrobiaceae bacterium]